MIMATDNKDKVLNVPNLRFPEFTEEWKKTKIGDITSKVGSGVTPKGGSAVYKTSGHLFIRSQNVGNGCFLLDDVAYIDEATHKKQINTELKDGDVLLNITGASIGRTTVVNKNVEGGNVNQHVCIIRLLEDYSPNYICNYLLSYGGQKQIDSFQAGGNREGLNFEQIRSIKFFIPSFREQSKIASLLSLLEERIATQNKIIEQLQSLIKGIYDKTFANFSKYQTLSAICKIQKGQQINGEELSEFGEYYVMNGGIEPSGYYDKYNTMPNTISISEGGNSCGYVQFNTVPFWSGGHCYSLQDIDIEYSTHFVYHYLKSKEKEIMALRIGSGLPNIQKKDLEKFLIPVLSLETQISIVNGINKIETKLKHEKDILSAYQTQKAYLLRNLFI